ncbi:hypothetical protein L0668_02005 [Paraglaciecola aquimarina]|uniref:Uncharacterized protein n=1 Tax=Paraglaciecola algarum TaxID=3050085 RepID=A0ABS9D2N1_9ALTE|nr:hypothetical protein [Paraglaciecola sp. G1-23]MCF2946864.1 hypothetical protein [Paraglaciecola sp. G1-23]
MKVLLSLVVVIALISLVWFAQHANQPMQPATKHLHAPVISRHDILTATDFLAGIQQAVAINNQDDIDKWIFKAVEVAEAAELPIQDIQYIQSDLARNFLIFQAKRKLFNQEIQQAYYKIEDITPIKERYPEAADLFTKVDNLLLERNKLIQKLAAEMADGQSVDDEILKLAGDKWKQEFAKKVPKLDQESF